MLTWNRNILLLYVYFFVFFILLITLPVVCCLLTVSQINLACREDLSDRLELRHDDEAHEAGLTVRDVCLLAIAQKRDRQVQLLFKISLIEEFLEQEIDPLLHDFKVSRGIGEVAGVHNEFKELLLGVKDRRAVCVVDELVTII